MSEILLYKANECISKLSQAEDVVNSEIQRLEQATQLCLEGLDETFRVILSSVEKRRNEFNNAIVEAKNAKKKVLEEQLALIQTEKDKVTEECDGLQHQVEVRYITQRISSLGEKLDSASALGEPRENAFLTCDLVTEALAKLESALAAMGRVRTSTTFPSLSTLHIKEACVVRLEAIAILTTVDYHGNVRTNGGDPIAAEVSRIEDETVQIEATIVDKEDGTYQIKFRPPAPGKYSLKVSVMERPVRFSPLEITVSEHNNPVRTYGSRGSGKDQFLQPVAVAMDNLAGTLYVVDTGNSRLKVLTPDLQLVRHLDCEGLSGRSCTGVAVNEDGEWLAVVNWRSRFVTRLSNLGDTLSAFTHTLFQEPIDVAIDSNYGHILVADNGPSCVFVFDTEGKLLFQVGKKGSQKGCFNLISCVTIGPGGEIVVADSRIQVFSAKGDFLQELFPEGKGRGRYGGVAVDSEGMVIASRSEKGRNFVQVFRLSDGALLSTLDSHESKLKRPSGLATTNDRHVVVVDLGNDCIKKYRYW
uniref:B-box C-terminal domain-containing protein n=1 Tax=Clastoptera arizonana TaxID=38151 RepID=A0A1B6CX18_9HEMI